jgi:hypothetical protein
MIGNFLGLEHIIAKCLVMKDLCCGTRDYKFSRYGAHQNTELRVVEHIITGFLVMVHMIIEFLPVEHKIMKFLFVQHTITKLFL